MVVNATPLLSDLTGVGQLVYEICRRFSEQDGAVDLFTPLKTYSSLEEAERSRLSLPMLKKIKQVCRHLPFKDVLRGVCAKSGGTKTVYDLYWEPNYVPTDAVESRHTVTTVCDLSVHDHPEWHPSDRVSHFNQYFLKRIGRSDLVMTISEFSRQRFLELQQEIPADRVRVIPCGINPDVFRRIDAAAVSAFRQRHRLPEKFILFVGTLEPRKNLSRLLTAFENLPASYRDGFPLVLAGASGWQNKEILERIRRLGSGVRRFGYLRRQEDLALIYNAASVFVFPSLYEGFGIPPLEAMACGTPVCLSSIPVFHEVYGDQDICYADPYSPDSLTDALKRIADDSGYRQQLIRRGDELSRMYTWDRAFDGYRAVFNEFK